MSSFDSCKRLVFSKDNKSIYGQCLKCNYKECKCVFITIKCNNCEKKIILINKEEIKPNEIIKCPNCKKEVNCSYESNESVLKDNLMILNIAEGNGINFGNGNIDENFIAKNDLIIKCDKIYKNPSLIGVNSDMEMTSKNQKEFNFDEKQRLFFEKISRTISNNSNIPDSFVVNVTTFKSPV